MNKKKIYPSYFLIIPLIVFIIFFFVPSTVGYLYAFTDWNPYVEKLSFVGMKNFIEVIQNKTLSIAFVNTIIIAVVKTVVVTVLGMIIALMLNRGFRTSKALRTIYFMPAIFSALIVGLIFSGLFDTNNGVINLMLGKIMGKDVTIAWLGNRWMALLVINLAEIWRSTGYGVVITLAALQSVPSDYIEAARVDGASSWQQFRKIVLPMIMPSVNVNILFSLIGGLKMFDLIMVLTAGGPGHDTESFGTIILSEMSRDRYAQSVTINLIFSILLVVVAVLYQKMSKKWEANVE
ncbi:MAG: carbohydrate ABC transporter permease [Oliverpabstia sp.]